MHYLFLTEKWWFYWTLNKHPGHNHKSHDRNRKKPLSLLLFFPINCSPPSLVILPLLFPTLPFAVQFILALSNLHSSPSRQPQQLCRAWMCMRAHTFWKPNAPFSQYSLSLRLKDKSSKGVWVERKTHAPEFPWFQICSASGRNVVFIKAVIFTGVYFDKKIRLSKWSHFKMIYINNFSYGCELCWGRVFPSFPCTLSTTGR